MKNGKAADISVEVWKCVGEMAMEFLRILDSETMSVEWMRSVLVLIFKNKSNVMSCSNNRVVKLMSPTMMIWERTWKRS